MPPQIVIKVRKVMLYFESDYTEGAHELVLESLIKSNMEHLSGYGSDAYCESAKGKIKALCGCEADVHFLVGGTQTNKTVISSLLLSYEGVVAASSGHIGTHEAGAIEASGHKVLPVDHVNGKLLPEALEAYLNNFFADENRDHMVFPGMVYISHPTEYGTLYTKDELKRISEICERFDLYLYLDGARLGYGLASEGTDITLKDIASLCDVFYIGGTKVGALCGEAVVFTGGCTPKQFMTIVKQNGALLAKGRLLGVQFDALFTDDLYFRISKHAIDCANKLREVFRAKKYNFYIETVTNQIFILLEDKEMGRLKKLVKFSFWERIDDTHCVVRFATSWATDEKDISALEALL